MKRENPDVFPFCFDFFFLFFLQSVIAEFPLNSENHNLGSGFQESLVTAYHHYAPLIVAAHKCHRKKSATVILKPDKLMQICHPNALTMCGENFALGKPT